MIGAVDINGFIKSACHFVFRKHSSSDMEPTRGSVDGDRFVAYVEEILVMTIFEDFKNHHMLRVLWLNVGGVLYIFIVKV